MCLYDRGVNRRSGIDRKEIEERVDAILRAGPDLGPRGLRAGVTHDTGDEDEVRAAANERGTEGLPEHVRGGLVPVS